MNLSILKAYLKLLATIFSKSFTLLTILSYWIRIAWHYHPYLIENVKHFGDSTKGSNKDGARQMIWEVIGRH